MAHDILIVDDEADIRMLIAGILEDEGYSTREASNSDEALRELQARRPNLVIQDIWLQGSKLDGLEVLGEIKRDHPMVPVVMISGHGTIDTAVSAIKEGAYDFIEKPYSAERLVKTVLRGLEKRALTLENRNLRRELELHSAPGPRIIGRTPAMEQLRSIHETLGADNAQRARDIVRMLVPKMEGEGAELAEGESWALEGLLPNP